MNYAPIIRKIKYWREYDGVGDKYRQTHDLDCVLTDGNLLADTIFSLWLPLRYTLNFFEAPSWTYWKNYEQDYLRPHNTGLKDCKPFLSELEQDIETFLPEHEITSKLIRLFLLGQTRSNVMLLPCRSWNSKRGYPPYWDYLPHFLWDMLNGSNTETVCEWIRREKLSMLFQDETIAREKLLDLAGTGNVRYHAPKDIVLPVLLDNYVHILELREAALGLSA